MPVQRPRRTTLASIATSLLLLAGLLLATPADAGTAADEQLFVQLINQTRAGAGLPPLAVDGELKSQARSWASSMASTGQLAHAPDISRGISAPWTVLGENVGVHGIQDVRQLYQAFVASPSHYANIVDARYTHVGVGVVVDGDGGLWTTHRFMATAQAPSTTTPPATAPPTTRPPTTAPPATAPPITAADSSTTGPTSTSMSTSTSTPASTASSPPGAMPATDEPAAAIPVTPETFGSGIADAGPEEQAPAAIGAGEPDSLSSDVEPVRAGPGRPDIEAVEQMLVDLIEAGI